MAAAALAVMAAVRAAAPEPQVVFVASHDVEAFTEALEGFQRIFPGAVAVFLDAKDPLHTPALRLILNRRVSLIVAAGGEALAALAALKPDAPVVATMILHRDARIPGLNIAGSVHLDISAARIASEIESLFPSAGRLTLIRGPAEEAAAHAPAGIIDCARPDDLLTAFRSLRGKTDFVLTTPDSTLYNTATVKPLILASLEQRLPIAGFSASFVRSGAAAGVYPDFRDIGEQTGLLAQRVLAGQARGADEGPRIVVVAVNQRVLHILGLSHTNRPDLVLFR